MLLEKVVILTGTPFDDSVHSLFFLSEDMTLDINLYLNTLIWHSQTTMEKFSENAVVADNIASEVKQSDIYFNVPFSGKHHT